MCDASVLQALLLATLERLEGVEAVVAAADATSAAMEEKVCIPQHVLAVRHVRSCHIHAGRCVMCIDDCAEAIMCFACMPAGASVGDGAAGCASECSNSKAGGVRAAGGPSPPGVAKPAAGEDEQGGPLCHAACSHHSYTVSMPSSVAQTAAAASVF